MRNHQFHTFFNKPLAVNHTILFNQLTLINEYDANELLNEMHAMDELYSIPIVSNIRVSDM